MIRAVGARKLPSSTVALVFTDTGPGAGPYVGGTLPAIRRVGEVVGVVRGLDAVL